MAGTGQVPGGGLPFGGIYRVETPALDQVSQQLYAQQADRRKYQEQTSIQADETMNKELANVRSIDMADVMNSYGKYKNISMQMLNPRAMNNPTLYNQLQQQRNAALGETMGKINKSKAINDQMKAMEAERKTKPYLFSKDYGKLVSLQNNTPMDQMGQVQYNGKPIDLRDPNSFRYTGNGTKFADIYAQAAGKPLPIAGTETQKQQGLDIYTTQMEFGNTPAAFQTRYRNALTNPQAGDDAAAAWQAIPDDQKLDVNRRFQNIPPEKWRAMTGEDKPQIIEPGDPNNPVEQYAAYQAKLYAINEAPKAGAVRHTTDTEGKIRLQGNIREQVGLALEKARAGDANYRLWLQNYYKNSDKNEQANIEDATFDKLIDTAKQGGIKHTYTPVKGPEEKQYEIPVSDYIGKQLAIKDDKGRARQVSYFSLSEDGKTVRPVFEKEPGDETPSGTGNVPVDRGKPMTIGEFRLLYLKEYYGAKAALRSGGGGATPPPGAPGTPPAPGGGNTIILPSGQKATKGMFN